MKTLKDKINSLREGTVFNIPLIGSRGKLYKVTEKAIQINCANNGFVWIPKSQIVSFDEITGEMHLSLWMEKQINAKSRTSSGAY